MGLSFLLWKVKMSVTANNSHGKKKNIVKSLRILLLSYESHYNIVRGRDRVIFKIFDRHQDGCLADWNGRVVID